jgi:hypothetical protein
MREKSAKNFRDRGVDVFKRSVRGYCGGIIRRAPSRSQRCSASSGSGLQTSIMSRRGWIGSQRYFTGVMSDYGLGNRPESFALTIDAIRVYYDVELPIKTNRTIVECHEPERTGR